MLLGEQVNPTRTLITTGTKTGGISVAKGIEVARNELSVHRIASSKGETIAKVGTIVSAIMASRRCWLPLVLLAVGVSGAGIASTLEAYRPLFIVVTVGCLGAAFYFTYRPKTPVTGGNCCATEKSCCPPQTSRRLKMMTVNKAMLWLVTVMAVAFLLFPGYVGTLLGSNSGDSVTENMNRAVIRVEGMTCEGCSALVASAIRTAPGVLAVEVDYEKGEAVVGTEICCPIPNGKLLTALKDAGYDGMIIEPRNDSDSR